MANLDNITRSILDDAKKEAEQIVNEAQREADTRRNALMDQLDQEKADFERKKPMIQSGIEDLVRTAADRDIRNIRLDARQKTIDRVFKLAKEQLMAMDDKEYQKILDHFLKQEKPAKGAVLEIPKDRNYASDRVKVEKVSQLKSGFRLVQGGVCQNYDFGEVADSLRNTMDTSILDKIPER